MLFSSATGGAYWPIAIRCPSLGPFPSTGGGGSPPCVIRDPVRLVWFGGVVVWSPFACFACCLSAICMFHTTFFCVCGEHLFRQWYCYLIRTAPSYELYPPLCVPAVQGEDDGVIFSGYLTSHQACSFLGTPITVIAASKQKLHGNIGSVQCGSGAQCKHTHCNAPIGGGSHRLVPLHSQWPRHRSFGPKRQGRRRRACHLFVDCCCCLLPLLLPLLSLSRSL